MGLPDETIYCSEQINIPPAYPCVLKQYCKSAIRTQPYDLLRWSAFYFRSLADGEKPPVKKRLEYPEYTTPCGLSISYLRVLVELLGRDPDTSVPVQDLFRRWHGICLNDDGLVRLIALTGSRITVNWLHFVSVAAGTLTSSLTDTMVLLCELLTEEPEGGMATLPFAEFEDLYVYLAQLNCGPLSEEEQLTEFDVGEEDLEEICARIRRGHFGSDVSGSTEGTEEGEQTEAGGSQSESLGVSEESGEATAYKSSEEKLSADLPPTRSETSGEQVDAPAPSGGDEKDESGDDAGDEGDDKKTEDKQDKMQDKVTAKGSVSSTDNDEDYYDDVRQDEGEEGEEMSLMLENVDDAFEDSRFKGRLTSSVELDEGKATEAGDADGHEESGEGEDDESVEPEELRRKSTLLAGSDETGVVGEWSSGSVSMLSVDNRPIIRLEDLNKVIRDKVEKQMLADGQVLEERGGAEEEEEERLFSTIGSKLLNEEALRQQQAEDRQLGYKLFLKYQRQHLPGIGPSLDKPMVDKVLDFMEYWSDKQQGMVMPRNIRNWMCPPLDLEHEDSTKNKTDTCSL